MTNKAPEKIIDRIRKCLKLGRKGSGATEAEAEAAISAAKKLMAEHNVQMSDVEFKEEVQQGVKAAADSSSRFNKDTWELAMAKVCDNIFTVEHYLDWRTREKDGRAIYRMIFVGVGVDSEIAAEVYTTLLKIVRNMGSKHGYNSADHRSYCMGVAVTLRKRSEEYIKQTPKEEVKCRGMVVVKNQLITVHMKELSKKLGLKPIRARSGPGRPGAYDHGVRDGADVNLNFRNALKHGGGE
jgi:hypothetical protein